MSAIEDAMKEIEINDMIETLASVIIDCQDALQENRIADLLAYTDEAYRIAKTIKEKCKEMRDRFGEA